MIPAIDRVKISAAGKNQLITLKRRTGIEHNNVLCRHALCASLANPSKPPLENINFVGGLEIDWKVFAGEAEQTYWNLIILRCKQDESSVTAEEARQTLTQHLHRGLSYLVSNPTGLPIEANRNGGLSPL
jgi:DNA sulfur modification protein DndE